MKAIKITLLAGALVAASGVAAAQPGENSRGPAAEVTRDQALARADQRFQRLDGNRDGSVTQEEARQGMQARVAQRQQRRAERQGQAFERFDTNRDGQISRDEFEQRRGQRAERREQRAERRGQRGPRAMRGMRGMRGGQFAARMFGEDGVITAEEFRTRALQRFDRVDANRDGRITAEERREVRQRMRTERRARRQAPVQN